MSANPHDTREQRIREEILRLTGELHRVRSEQAGAFRPGESAIPYGGRVLGLFARGSAFALSLRERERRTEEDDEHGIHDRRAE